jgi:DNA-directed RNA polymerase specialized sigma24 family protein
MSDTPPDTPAATAAATATQVFVDHRELLFSIVYSMLGSVADTEDVLQETWLSWAPRTQAASAAPIATMAGRYKARRRWAGPKEPMAQRPRTETPEDFSRGHRPT